MEPETHRTKDLPLMQTTSTSIIDTLRAERDQITPQKLKLEGELERITADHKKLSRTEAALNKAIDDLTAISDPNWKPAPKAAKSAGGRSGDPDYPAIAAWIAKAKADGTYSLHALASAFDAKLSTVANWVGACRKRGLLTKDDKLVDGAGAKTPPQEVAVAKPAGGKVLACTAPGCEAEFDPTNRIELIRHCRDQHGRRPTAEETQPVAA